MFENERLNKVLEMYSKGLITKSKAEEQAYSIPDIEIEELANFINGLDNVNVEKKEETWEDRNKKLKEENRKQAEETRERQAQREAERLEKEAKAKHEEELRKIDEENDRDLNEKVEYLSSLKDEKGKVKYPDLMERKEAVEAEEDYAEYQHFVEMVNSVYDEVKYKEKQAEAVKNSQERYNSMTSEERQQEAISNYGIDSEQGKKAKETNDRINSEIQRDRYNNLIKEDSELPSIDLEVAQNDYSVNVDNANTSNIDDTLVTGMDVIQNADGTLSNIEASQVEPSVNAEPVPNASENSQPEPDLSPQPSRLVSMIAGAKSSFQEIVNNKANVALAACIAIGSAVAIIATGPVGFTALGTLASGVGSAGLIGSGSVLSAAAVNEFNKGKKL